jgi:hypothetical protein
VGVAYAAIAWNRRTALSASPAPARGDTDDLAKRIEALPCVSGLSVRKVDYENGWAAGVRRAAALVRDSAARGDTRDPGLTPVDERLPEVGVPVKLVYFGCRTADGWNRDARPKWWGPLP